MVGVDGGTVVADVHLGTFASAVALSFTGPQHAGLLASLLGDLDVVVLGHVADGLVSRALEAFHQSFVSIGVHYRLGPCVGSGRRLRVIWGSLVSVPLGVGWGVDKVVPGSWERR